MKKIPFVVLILTCLFGYLKAQTIDQLLQEAKTLRTQFKEEEALQKYLEVLKKDQLQYDALCGASFMYCRIGNRTLDEAKKKEYFNGAKRLAEYAVKIKPNDAESNFVMAAAVGRAAEYLSTKERVASSTTIKKHAEAALAANPNHPGANHVMGMWHYRVANLSWAERSAANIIFGGIPKGASNENAVKYISKAISLRPDYILYVHDLGLVYKAMEKYSDAISTFKKAVNMKSLTKDDPYLKEHSQNMIEDCEALE